MINLSAVINLTAVSHQVCGAIECLEDAAANPLESLSETYKQGILSEAAKAELTALSPSDRVSLLREWRRFLNAYLGGFQVPYPGETRLADFWRDDERAWHWVAALDRAELRLWAFGPAFEEVSQKSFDKA